MQFCIRNYNTLYCEFCIIFVSRTCLVGPNCKFFAILFHTNIFRGIILFCFMTCTITVQTLYDIMFNYQNKTIIDSIGERIITGCILTSETSLLLVIFALNYEC